MRGISKHQRWTPDKKWIPGKLRMMKSAYGQCTWSLRKLMRAQRRGKVPEEQQGIIQMAIEKAARRRPLYLNSCRARSAARAQGAK